MSQIEEILTSEAPISDDVLEEMLEGKREPWNLIDDGGAEWALLKIRRHLRQHREAMAAVEEERARLNEFEQAARSRMEREVNFFEGILMDYHRRQLAVDKDRKTIQLPAGTLRSKTEKKPSVKVVDAVALLEHLEETKRESLLRRKVEIEKAALNEAVLEDGEVFPGVETEPPVTRFYVDVAP